MTWCSIERNGYRILQQSRVGIVHSPLGTPSSHRRHQGVSKWHILKPSIYYHLSSSYTNKHLDLLTLCAGLSFDLVNIDPPYLLPRGSYYLTNIIPEERLVVLSRFPGLSAAFEVTQAVS
jgi:hypothetical protein